MGGEEGVGAAVRYAVRYAVRGPDAMGCAGELRGWLMVCDRSGEERTCK